MRRGARPARALLPVLAPDAGVTEPGTEGNYLFVNKNLVEAAAVFVVLAFRTGRIAGLDLLLARPRAAAAPVAEA